jgi:GT2 family glycosyltransferase
MAENVSPLKELDFLALPVEGDSGVTRHYGEFAVQKPWALAQFGQHRIAPGWWIFECEAEGDLSTVNVLLSNSVDPLIVLPASASAQFRIRFSRETIFRVSIALSPWPSCRRFTRLRLRKLSSFEVLVFLSRGLARLLGREKPVDRLLKVLGRIVSGQPVGVRADQGDVVALSRVALPQSASIEPSYVQIERNGIFAIVVEGDRLHTDAFAIAADTFSTRPEVEVIYADSVEAGGLLPKPEWDGELAAYADFIGTPVFFKSKPARLGAPFELVSAVVGANGEAAVARIALPLVDRDFPIVSSIKAIDMPMLAQTPRVSVIIPTKTRMDLLAKCLDGLVRATDYHNLEIIIVDNGCPRSQIFDLISRTSHSRPVRHVADPRPFNYPRLNNVGVAQSTGEIVLLLNDDIEPIDPTWLRRMVDTVSKPHVGAVGARLLYPDYSIQHAGVVLGIGGVCGHLWKGMKPAETRLLPQITCPGSRLAVTAACLMVRRELYSKVGGLDESMAVALNDIDFCLRLNAAGYYTRYRGDAVLIHHESQSRGHDANRGQSRRRLGSETEIFLSRWGHLLASDPYGSPAFDPRYESGAVHSFLLPR